MAGSLDEVSSRAGLSKPFLSRLENGQRAPSPEALERLIAVLPPMPPALVDALRAAAVLPPGREARPAAASLHSEVRQAARKAATEAKRVGQVREPGEQAGLVAGPSKGLVGPQITRRFDERGVAVTTLSEADVDRLDAWSWRRAHLAALRAQPWTVAVVDLEEWR